MKIIVVVDDANGMMFNKRRQSQDKVLREKIKEIIGDSRLWCNRYTASQFKEENSPCCVDEEFLDKAGQDEYCFVEDRGISSYINQMEEWILFHWNRKYPSDLKLDVVPEQEGFVCVYTEEFAGNSHEKITMERWMKK